MFKFCAELVSATAGSGCVGERVVEGGLGGFTDGDVEIKSNNWMFWEVLVGDGEEIDDGVNVFCK